MSDNKVEMARRIRNINRAVSPRVVNTYEELEAALLELDNGDTTAYDGSDMEQIRELTARERDVLCRLINDAISMIDSGNEFGWGQELGRLQLIKHIIDPRRD